MKNEIRKEILLRRSHLSEKYWIEKSIEIQKKLIEEDFYQNATSILVYCYFDREVMTDIILSDALEKGKVVCVPFNDWEEGIIIPSRIYSKEDIDISRKIPQPFKKDPFPVEDIKLAVIPGVVFDIYGNRIGMGKGFFDRFLKAAGSNILKVSLAFDMQVLEKELPVDLWDQKIDVIITETQIIKREDYGRKKRTD
ncbi:MAG: 5-formyltetrahydrofolate cyclo-ligase [Candidatus Ratteibacteria bacterium]|nr:5-formyltetrahydrofolate cyclo-ligase [Candidatus Ratteibacteria bacterium]